MKRISKGVEPKEWRVFRQTAGVVKYEANKALRDSLMKEQGFICAYCMRRIPVADAKSKETSRIEHIKCRDNYPDLQLNYTNMVVCCPGCIDEEDHCDKSKKNQETTFSLFDANTELSISYRTKDGHIKSSNPEWDREMNEVLNLNNARLKLNRKQVVEGLRAVLEKKKWSESALEIRLAEWESFDQNHFLKPYCGVIIWYLRKKLNQNRSR